jgi:SAM-dependent methyltransferase
VEIRLEEVATSENYYEEGYLADNPDVQGYLPTPYQHLVDHGVKEGRKIRHSHLIRRLKANKIERVKSIIRTDAPYQTVDTQGGPALCFLDDDRKVRYGVEDTDNVSAHLYDANIVALIEEYRDGLLLDCGAGKRPVYYDNVVNYEIVGYDSTDVLGVAEELPFVDNAFDAVISVAVLEHVRDPFKSAAEIVRVLKPGGKLFCCVPFLQPFHGFPNHYYNMTHVGLANLFHDLEVAHQAVYPSTGPIHTLTWFLRLWVNALAGQTREDFLDMRVRDLLDDGFAYLNQPCVLELSETTNFTLASATVLTAVKKLPASVAGTNLRHDSGHAHSRVAARLKALVRGARGLIGG